MRAKVLCSELQFRREKLSLPAIGTIYFNYGTPDQDFLPRIRQLAVVPGQAHQRHHKNKSMGVGRGCEHLYSSASTKPLTLTLCPASLAPNACLDNLNGSITSGDPRRHDSPRGLEIGCCQLVKSRNCTLLEYFRIHRQSANSDTLTCRFLNLEGRTMRWMPSSSHRGAPCSKPART
ncbi:hypothetical protein BR93DRAFT_805033 [Coniochaeta sp. PMI_546]|nr:hypothetical protein BR93DRAFT_805033 [Coniochaeta sp. PMI_546]